MRRPQAGGFLARHDLTLSSGLALARRLYERFKPLFPFLAMFSGVALLIHIIAGISLAFGLALTTLAMVGGLTFVLVVSTPDERRRIVRTIAVAAGAGFLATLTYGVSKTLLSQLDPSPYNPFEAIRIFGTLIAGTNAPVGAIWAAGVAFHLLNGTAFGIAYTFLFARGGNTSWARALATGVGWGVFLETFQLTLYPGWLDIRFYAEFATISALGHLVYGAALGGLARTLLRATDPQRKMAAP
ncbi:MAG: hypothetical protein ACRDGJ_10170 [Candidatus Limnocylindria bacterium]